MSSLFFTFFFFLAVVQSEKHSTTAPSSLEALEIPYIHDYLIETGTGNREYFGVHAVLQGDLDINSTALEWLTLSMDDTFYIVGRMKKSITLISIQRRPKTFIYQAHEVVTDFQWEIRAVATCEYNNVFTDDYAGVISVALDDLDNTLHWYTLDNYQLTLRGTLKCPHKIVTMTMYKVEDSHELLIVYEGTHGEALASRYSFGFSKNKTIKYRKSQDIPLSEPTTSISVGFGNHNVYLGFVQKSLNKVHIYALDLPSYLYGDFYHVTDFKSEGVTSVQFFKNAGRQYWLVNGRGACIYRLESDNSIKKAPSPRFGKIDEWMVINFRTYREDVLLLGRKGTQMISWTWQGTLNGFQLTSYQIPCWKFETKSQTMAEESCEDMSCIYTQQWEGSAVVAVGEFPFIIFPDSKNIGQIYHVVGYLESIKSPEEEIFLLEAKQANVEDKWNFLKSMIIQTHIFPPQEICQVEPLLDVPSGGSFDIEDLRSNIRSLSEKLTILERSIAMHQNLVGAPPPLGLSGSMRMNISNGKIQGQIQFEEQQRSSTTPVTGTLKFQTPLTIQRDDQSELHLDPKEVFLQGGLRSSIDDYGHIEFEVKKMYINEKTPIQSQNKIKDHVREPETNHPWNTREDTEMLQPLHTTPNKRKIWNSK